MNSPSKPKRTMLNMRMSEACLRRWKREAFKQDVSLTEWIRTVCDQYVTDTGSKKKRAR